MMAHYRLVGFLLSGAVFAVLVGACGGSGQPSTGPAAPLIMSETGIGAIEIGEPPGAVIDALTGWMGGPDTDSQWIDADSDLFGKCPAEKLRAVGWGSLYLFFTADGVVTADNEHIVGRFFTYSYGFDFSRNEGGTDPRELGLATAAGIGLGSTRSELRQAYGDDLTESYDELADIWRWSVATTNPSFLRGLLSGPDIDATVVLIERAPGCGDV
jgi:hypothetical protein